MSDPIVVWRRRAVARDMAGLVAGAVAFAVCVALSVVAVLTW